MPRALVLELACRQAASAISMRTDSHPAAKMVVGSAAGISGVLVTHLFVEPPYNRSHQGPLRTVVWSIHSLEDDKIALQQDYSIVVLFCQADPEFLPSHRLLRCY